MKERSAADLTRNEDGPEGGDGDNGKRTIMDLLGTSHRPDGPWPTSDHSVRLFIAGLNSGMPFCILFV